MATSNRAGCEVQIEGAWRLVSLTEAHTQHRAAQKRCPSCHGRVHTQGSYSAEAAVAMVHKRSHGGCPRIPKLYAGTPKRHPQAVE